MWDFPLDSIDGAPLECRRAHSTTEGGETMAKKKAAKKKKK
jgi:hypothetical protein